jgi:1-phosphofructokinase/tagatose 6-phosphate kinase
MAESNFLAVCMNPTLQKTLLFPLIHSNEVNRTAEHRLDVSGKGINVCRVLGQLGKKAIHLTQLGGTLLPLFLELCEKDSIDIRHVESNSQIRFCYTLLEEGSRGVTELVEESEAVSEETESRILNLYRFLMLESDWIIISGTKARGFSNKVVPEMVRLAKERGKKMILDIRSDDLLSSLAYKPDIVKPNMFEFVSTFFSEEIKQGKFLRSEEDVLPLVKEKAKELSLNETSFVITRGSKPVWVFQKGNFTEISFEAVSPVNTTGSGDAFTAGLASSLADGHSLENAINEGIKCGALNAQFVKPGIIK